VLNLFNETISLQAAVAEEKRPRIGTCNAKIGVAKLGEKRNLGRID
jgi:hypothetical protein